MTPKEKAEELYRTYIDYTFGDFNCRQCALIAVDEIISANPSFSAGWNLGIKITGLITHSMLPSNYWQEVKQEIEKL